MSDHDDSRRTFLSGSTAAVATAASVPSASAQSGMVLNDPKVVREIEVEFAGYNEALGKNDVAALNRYFFESSNTVRYGIAENLYGFAEIASYRAGVPSGTPPQRERTVISTFGNDFATVATMTRRPQAGKVGRTMQTWVRFPQGWRIVSAHVSTIDDPAKR